MAPVILGNALGIIVLMQNKGFRLLTDKDQILAIKL